MGFTGATQVWFVQSNLSTLLADLSTGVGFIQRHTTDNEDSKTGRGISLVGGYELSGAAIHGRNKQTKYRRRYL